MDYIVASSLIAVLFDPLTKIYGGFLDCMYIRGYFSTNLCISSKSNIINILCRIISVKDRAEYFEVVGRLIDLMLKNRNARLAVLQLREPKKIVSESRTLIFHIPFTK
jgi:hypothetical protein